MRILSYRDRQHRRGITTMLYGLMLPCFFGVIALAVDLSVVVPLYDEEENVGPMMPELLQVLDGLPLSSEVILVDDGSTDQTAARARQWCHHDPRIRLIELRRNFGQTAAISAGFDHARGRVVIQMDGDLQNDPRDIPGLLAKLEDASAKAAEVIWTLGRSTLNRRSSLPVPMSQSWMVWPIDGSPTPLPGMCCM